MSEFSGGGFTGDADGAPYSGYAPGPADQSPADVPANPSGASEDELRRLQEIDKPIEHDPIGQALVSLPVGLAQGVVTAGAEGVGLGAELLKEGVAWAASELGITAGEYLVDGGSEHDATEQDATEQDATEQPPPEEQYDGGVVDEGAGYE